MAYKSIYYILDENNEAIPCSVEEWLKDNRYEDYEQLKSDKNRVGLEQINDYEVSTVFLGIDHNYHEEGKPILFETMIFGTGSGCGYQTRCSTWKEAEQMHKDAIQWIHNGCKDDLKDFMVTKDKEIIKEGMIVWYFRNNHDWDEIPAYIAPSKLDIYNEKLSEIMINGLVRLESGLVLKKEHVFISKEEAINSMKIRLSELS